MEVLDGGKGNYPASTCVFDADTTVAHGAVIASMCCDPSDTSFNDGCRRWVGADDDAGCVAGRSPPRPHTFAQTEALCQGLGLQLCETSLHSSQYT